MDLRRADDSDLDFLLRLRNEATSLRYSKRGRIDRDLALRDYLRNDRKHPYIASCDGLDVGYAIFEEHGSGKLEISVSLDSGQRSKGLGAELIRVASGYALQMHDASVVIANVAVDNLASRAAFERAGYRRVNDEARAPSEFEEALLLYRFPAS